MPRVTTISLNRVIYITLFIFFLHTCISGKIFQNFEEAIQATYPDCTVKKQTVILTPSQKEILKAQYSIHSVQSVLYLYHIFYSNTYAGTVYFDKHPVRTLPEVLMIAIDSDDQVYNISVLSFNEPLEYLPKAKWYAHLKGLKIMNTSLNNDIHAVSGATLTVRATANAIKKILSIHTILKPELSEILSHNTSEPQHEQI